MKASDQADEIGRVLYASIKKDAFEQAQKIFDNIAKGLSHSQVAIDGKLPVEMEDEIVRTLYHSANLFTITFVQRINDIAEMIHTDMILKLMGVDTKDMNWKEAKRTAQERSKVVADGIGEVLEELKKEYYDRLEREREREKKQQRDGNPV